MQTTKIVGKVQKRLESRTLLLHNLNTVWNRHVVHMLVEPSSKIPDDIHIFLCKKKK